MPGKALKISLSSFSLGRLKIPESHILIIGPTGSGKTNTAKVLLEEIIKKGIKVLVLDWHGEYKGLEKYTPGDNLSMNIFGNTTKTVDVEFIIDLLSQVFQLSEPQWYLLQKSLKESRIEGLKLSGLVNAVEEQPVRDYKEFEVKAALLRRLALLNEGVLGNVLNGDQEPYFLFERDVIVDLSPIPVKYRSLLALVILKHLYDYAVFIRGMKDRMVHATLIEEAWNVIPYRARWEQPSIGERLFLEIRKFGEQMIGVSQRIEDLSERVVKNAQLILIHSPYYQDLVKMGFSSDLVSKTNLRGRKGIAYVIYPDRIKIVKVRKAYKL